MNRNVIISLLLFASCSSSSRELSPADAAYSNWQRAITDAKAQHEEVTLLNGRFMSEGVNKPLLDEYESALTAEAARLLDALAAAEQFAYFSPEKSTRPLAESLHQYRRTAESFRYMGERHDRKTMSKKAQEMQKFIVEICANAGGNRSGIPDCQFVKTHR